MASDPERKGSHPSDLLDLEIIAGKIAREEVDRARAFWRERLQGGVTLPSGERVTMSAAARDHVLLRDDRIRREPERMERLLHHCFEIRTAHSNRRRALSGWREEDQDRYGYAILENDGRMVTMHLVRAAEWRRLSRQGERLWRRDE